MIFRGFKRSAGNLSEWLANQLGMTRGVTEFSHFIFHLPFGYGSWFGAPLRLGDEAAFLRVQVTVRQALRAGTVDTLVLPPSRWDQPVAAWASDVDGEGGWRFFSNQCAKAQRMADGAETAMALAAGETPPPSAGIEVKRAADGGWDVVLQPKDRPSANGRTYDDRRKARLKKFWQPWHVPPR